MVQLSMINPHINISTFARFKLFYAKCPFAGDFYPFKTLLSVIRGEQKFKSHFNDTATDRENLIRACKAPTFGTNHQTNSYLASQPPNTLSEH